MNIFGQRKKDQEVMAKSSGYKTKLKKRKSSHPTNYALREKGYKKGYLQPPKLNPIRKNKEAITRILKKIVK
jgi:hypothetical protein